MAKITAYKFVNPGVVATSPIPVVRAASKQILATNRLGSTVEGIGKVVEGLISTNNSILVFQKSQLLQKKKEERRRRDAEAEQKQEIANRKSARLREIEAKKKKSDLEGREEVKKDGENFVSWAEGFFGPFVNIFKDIASIVVAKGVYDYLSDSENRDKIQEFFERAYFVFDKIYGFFEYHIKGILDGFTALTGEDSTFIERLKGLGTVLTGIIALKAIMNPFGLIGDILNLIDGIGSLFDQREKNPKNRKLRPGDSLTDQQLKKLGLTPEQVKEYKKARQAGAGVQDALKQARRVKPKPNLLQRALNAGSTAIDKTRSFAADQFNRLKNLAKSTWGLSSEWAQNAYSNLSEVARKKWEQTVTLSRKLRASAVETGNKFKGKLGDLGNWAKKGMDGLGEKAKNFVMEQIVGRLQKVFNPVLTKLKSVGNKLFDMLFSTPLGKRAAEALKKRGLFPPLDNIGPITKKVGGKALPIIGGLLNMLFAYDRFQGGDPFGGMLEAISAGFDISGLFGFVPGPGISLGIDAYMFARDLIPGMQDLEEMILNAIPGVKQIGDTMKQIGKQLPPLPPVGLFARGGKVALYAGHADMAGNDPSGAFGTHGGVKVGSSGSGGDPNQPGGFVPAAKGKFYSNEAYFNHEIARRAAQKAGGRAVFRSPIRTRTMSDSRSNVSRGRKDAARGMTIVEVHQDAPSWYGGSPGTMGNDMAGRGKNNSILKAINNAYGIHRVKKSLGFPRHKNSTLLEIGPLDLKHLRSANSYIETHATKLANAIKKGAAGQADQVVNDQEEIDSTGGSMGSDESTDYSFDEATAPSIPSVPTDPRGAMDWLYNQMTSLFGGDEQKAAEAFGEIDLKFSPKETIGNYDFSKAFSMDMNAGEIIPFPVAITMTEPLVTPMPINSGDRNIFTQVSPLIDK